MKKPHNDRAAVARRASPSEQHAAEVPLSQSAPESRSASITAIEIENFKGIGRPLRIDLRPITLLFGRNSAGKSTILHALCYAHEILRHRNVDPGKVELGGDQVDLGGFQNLVHGHDIERVVRLRLELNLKNWCVPDQLLEKLAHPALSESVGPGIADDHKDWVLKHARGELARTGWVEIHVGTRSGIGPMVTLYGVGVNEAFVGRIVSGPRSNELEFNWAHPWFDSLHREASVRSPTDPRGTASDSPRKTSEELHRAAVIWGSTSGLPSWNENLDVDGAPLTALRIVDSGPSNARYARFRALITCAVVGIGQTLCVAGNSTSRSPEEQPALRYLGPLRRLRRPADVEHGSRGLGQWSDGSKAWNVLAPASSDSQPDGERLIDKVNEWITRHDRLDTGYRLDQASTLELASDVPFVKEIRAVEGALSGFRDHTGMVNKIVDGIESGRNSSAVRQLVRALAMAPVRSTLQLRAVDSELPVRMSDVGTGLSQLLPVVVAVLDPDRPGITAIEQPELHAHPKLQVELGDLFAHAADDGRVFLLENHSEHLMLRLLRRIEETHDGELPEGKPTLRPEQVSVVYLDQVDGEVRATRLRIDETGEFIDRWPHGFFEERDDELF
ncbi:MAG: DUF3696 domain-containing protein [Acidobacteria bacterium]|nr:DUF3696 domain-containing protein [Acidobacteriota bacterium]